jgi:ADP-ribose pyrophosphatase YjhB (NUDIX family)
MISERDLPKGKVLVSACAIIEGKDRDILLMYEGDLPYHKWWVLPGGYVRPDETVEYTVSREVEEETGLKISSPKLIGIYEDFLTENNESINHIIIAYLAEMAGGRILFTKEAMAYKWLTLKEALDSTEIPEVFKRILSDYGRKRKGRFSLTRAL